MLDSCTRLAYPDIFEAVGMDDSPALALSFQAPVECWSSEYRSYLVRCREILDMAERVLGSRRSAENWLEREAFGLDGHAPCDLIATQTGCTLVKNLLTRIEYGVYT
ncbi:antitoxin Xre/MbcA/ParS toxin-binding domain-containing protein [Pseudomonas petroselini]|uniref:antitoxin Xre/MbcA/ParS toxin-binding domain-containing protein n=1 Tax=Pseudomonas petroselini TaxID=2899822 RepID=UPI0038686EFA